MALLKPPETVVEIVELPAAPFAIETELGDAEIAKAGVGPGGTGGRAVGGWGGVRARPVMATVEVPTVAVEETVKVSVELPEPGAAIEAGRREAVTPAGRPEAESEMALLKPPETAVVIVEVPVPPCA